MVIKIEIAYADVLWKIADACKRREAFKRSELEGGKIGLRKNEENNRCHIIII